MAFAYTLTRTEYEGTVKVKYGTWDGTGVTTGTIDTGFKTLLDFYALTEAIPHSISADTGSAGLITLTFGSGEAGKWRAKGW